MADINTDSGPSPSRKGSVIQIRRGKSHGAVRIDMTPMVDVAFLLLIFFMVTTVFRQPLAMEINMPDAGAQVKVPEQNVLTLVIDQKDALSWRLGTNAMADVAWRDLTKLFQDEAGRNRDLIILVKIHRLARYESMVEMMDTLEDAGMDRFSVVPLSDDEPVPSPEGR